MADKSVILTCACNTHLLKLDALDVDKRDLGEHDWFAEVYVIPAKASWRWRLSRAVGLLFGKEPYLQDVVLDGWQLVALRDFLNETYPSAGDV